MDQATGAFHLPEVIPDRLLFVTCLLYTSDAADDLLCVDLGGRRNIKKKNFEETFGNFYLSTHNTHFLSHCLFFDLTFTTMITL